MAIASSSVFPPLLIHLAYDIIKKKNGVCVRRRRVSCQSGCLRQQIETLGRHVTGVSRDTRTTTTAKTAIMCVMAAATSADCTLSASSLRRSKRKRRSLSIPCRPIRRSTPNAFLSRPSRAVFLLPLAMLFRRTFLRCDFSFHLFIHDLHPFIEVVNRQIKEVADWRFAVFGKVKCEKPESVYLSAPFKKRDTFKVTAMKSKPGRLMISSYLTPTTAAATCA